MPSQQAPGRTIRVSDRAYRIIQELKGDDTIQAVVDEALEQLRRRRMIDATNAAYAALKADPEAWAAELEERALWDATLADGSED